MDLGDRYRALADILDELDRSGVAVLDASPTETTDSGALVADVRIRVPAEATADPTERGVDPSLARPGIEPQADDSDEAGSPDEGSVGNQAGSTDTAGSGDGVVDTGVADDRVDSSGAAGEPDGEAPEAGRSAAGEAITCTHDRCMETFDTEHGMHIHRSKAHAGGRSARDPDRLATVYESNDSFRDMRDALDAGVSAQTVRRWMIDEGIHVPDDDDGTAAEGRTGADESRTGADQSRTGADESPEPEGHGAEDVDDATDTADPENPQPDPASSDDVADVDTDTEPAAADANADVATTSADRSDNGRDTNPATADADTEGGSANTPPDRLTPVDESLPDGVTVDDLRAAVEAAATLYDVQQRLDVDRETAQDVLAEYDLLELVHGRLADRNRREELKEEIDVRLQSNVEPANSSSD